MFNNYKYVIIAFCVVSLLIDLFFRYFEMFPEYKIIVTLVDISYIIILLHFYYKTNQSRNKKFKKIKIINKWVINW